MRTLSLLIVISLWGCSSPQRVPTVAPASTGRSAAELAKMDEEIIQAVSEIKTISELNRRAKELNKEAQEVLK